MLKLYIEAKVTDRDGKVISRQRRKLAHSFVKGWIAALCGSMNGSGAPDPDIDATDTSGAAVTLGTGTKPFRSNAGVGVTDFGIRVGTDDTAVTINDYALAAAIAEGAGGGQMEHLGASFNEVGVVGNVQSFEIVRIINNNSGGQINVREVGIYIYARTEGGSDCYLCQARDLITQDVPDGGSITITYTLRVVA